MLIASSGQVWVIYPFRLGPDGKQGYTELLYDFGDSLRKYPSVTKFHFPEP